MSKAAAVIMMAAAIGVGAAVLFWVQDDIPIQAARQRLELSGAMDFDALFAGISEESVGRQHRAIVAPASRVSGSAGDLAVAQMAEDEFRRLGMEVIVQRYAVTMPVTSRSTNSYEDGREVAGVSLLPFWPNVVRTCTTGPEGIVGKLVDVGTGAMEDLEGKDIRGNIALVRMTRRFDWLDAAKLGAVGIVFRPSEDPECYANKILQFPGNMPRFLADGPVDELVGKPVRIEARVDWEIREARNVYGVLVAPQAHTEALVLSAYTDSWSVVPDRAPGYYEACAPTALLEMARGLAAQREGLSRSVIFAAVSGRCLASEGLRQMVDGWATRKIFQENYADLKNSLAEARKRKAACDRAVAAYSEGDYWELDKAGEAALWREYGRDAGEVVTTALHAIINRYAQVAEDHYAAAKLAWVQAGRPEGGALFEAQLAGSHRLRRVRTSAGAEALSLKLFFGEVLEAAECRGKLAGALAQAQGHAQGEEQYAGDVVGVAEMFGRYEREYFLLLAPSAEGRRISYRGDLAICIELEQTRDAIVGKYLEGRGVAVDDPAVYGNYVVNGHRVNIRWIQEGIYQRQDREVLPVMQAGRVGLLFRGVSVAEGFQTPLDTKVNVADVTVQTQLLAGMAAQIASSKDELSLPGKGEGTIQWLSDYGGAVMMTGGSNSILPSRPVANALVVLKSASGGPFYIQRTRTGHFRFAAVEGSRADWLMANAYTIDDRSGQITGAKDLGPEGRKFIDLFFKSKLFEQPHTRVTLLLTRLAPTDIFGLTGPDGEELAIDIMDARFRTPPDEYSVTDYWGQGATIFCKPGDRFYALLYDVPAVHFFGRKGKELRGFLLGHGRGDQSEASESASFWGPGYLAGEDQRIVFQEVDAAVSLARANRERLAEQVGSGLANPISLELADKAEKLLAEGNEALEGKRYASAYRKLTSSLGISARAYPSIRTAVADALNGILLYMFLLVPFSLFAERLLLGASDIRARIGGTFGIFLLAFLAIRFTHPAYELVTSPMIVLVGFVIFMLCTLILAFISGKFADRIAALRRSGGGATEADSDVSRSSAAGAAFNLGINSMRKRKVRTAYTVTTLILISFALVCFTSPQPELVEQKTVQGSAGFDGLVFREPGNIAATSLRLGDKGVVAARRTYMQTSESRKVPVSYLPPEGGALRQAKVAGIVNLQSVEAQVTQLDKTLLGGGRWFERDDEPVCYISEVTAGELGIDPALAGELGCYVQLGEKRLMVLGVFDSVKVDAARDIDGESFLPEIQAYVQAEERQKRKQAKTDRYLGKAGAKQSSINYVAAAATAFVPLEVEVVPVRGGKSADQYSSVVVAFDDLPYGQMREAILEIMDRRPLFFSFALDGLSFFGGKVKTVGLEGVVDIVVPLLLASFIVFNTMLGSVYERQKEISVYSAVGLSPRHVFYLFLAESLVYAIIGAVGGYLLGLGLQWLSHKGGDFLGLTINYSSRSAIYVCLTLMGAVVVSSFVPARRAARIASPSEQVSWSIPPEVAPGKLQFDLPFTYIGRDIVGAVPFLTSWFDARGEDSSGEFSASAPEVEVSWSDQQPTFTVGATVWLRPYDLGVSQEVRVSVRPSGQGGVYVANVQIDILSGDMASWQRTNTLFIGILRNHLLSCRALGQRSRERLFDSGSAMLLGAGQ